MAPDLVDSLPLWLCEVGYSILCWGLCGAGAQMAQDETNLGVNPNSATCYLFSFGQVPFLSVPLFPPLQIGNNGSPYCRTLL